MTYLNDISITNKEAIDLGIIDGLGFVTSEKTAFKKVNAEILEQLKKGNLIFRKPWRDGYKIKGVVYGPHNYVSTNPYHGANAFFINIKNFLNNTDFKQFLTQKQIAARGGKLKNDAQAFPVFAFIKSVKTELNPKTNKEESTLLRGVIGYVVYPLEHTIDVKEIKRKEIVTSPDEIIIDAETLINNMPKLPPIKIGGDRAFYVPSADYVQMPSKKAFSKLNEYYSTLFHELSHSTGHKKRVGRDFSGSKGDTKYALEELIAELSAAYLCSVCDMPYYTLDNTAAYLKSWGNVLFNEIKNNPNFLLRAVYGATKAAKYIIGTTLEKKATTGVKNTGKEIIPNKTIKANLNQAIQDLLSLPKYSKLSSMAIGMFYSKFKNKNVGDTVEIKEGLTDKIFERLGELDFVSYYNGSEAELTESGFELINKITARYDTLKAKKSGTDLFPDLAGTKITDTGLLFIKRFVDFNNTVIDELDIAEYIEDLSVAIKQKKITKTHPYKNEINKISLSLEKVFNELNTNEFVKITIKDLKHLNEILNKEQQGLGFLPVVFAAAAGKFVEHFMHKSLSGLDDDLIDELIKLYEKTETTTKSNQTIVVGKVDGKTLNILKTEFNIDVKNYIRKVHFNEARHIFKMHGEGKETDKTQKPVTPLDFAMYPYIVSNYDNLIFEKNNDNKPTIKYQKYINNYFIVVEEIIESKKELRLKTIYIKKNKPLLKNNGLTGSRNAELKNSPIIKRPKRASLDCKDTKLKQSNKPLSGVMSVTQAINGKYDLIGLDGDYLKLIGEACKPTHFFIYGPGGSGKSTFTMKFANYMAQKGNKILYVAGEQFNTPVFSKMLTRLKIVDSPNFVIVKNLNTISAKGFDFIVIDSKDSLDFQIKDFNELHKKYPSLSTVILSQGTKAGGFTGSEKWRNLVDTMIYCENLIAYTNQDKNRWGAQTQVQILKLK